jgi:hypothetical protein
MSQAGIRWIAALTLAALLSGCFDDDTVSPNRVSSLTGGSQPVSDSGGGTPPPAPPPPNNKPTISGSPVTTILQGDSYSFRPVASDPDGDSLTFKISNKPAWASFDSKSGRLYGTPGAGDVGTYPNIRISVTDGQASAQLSGFTLTVEQIANGSATLSWTPPTENTDGSTLTNLVGYKIYYGRSSDSLSQVITIDHAGITTYVIENLSPAVYYFAMTSLNSQGTESERSATLKKTIG